MNCWEFRKCGMDKAGGCPAYPKGGRICFMLAGTLCDGGVSGGYIFKVDRCRECGFFSETLDGRALHGGGESGPL